MQPIDGKGKPLKRWFQRLPASERRKAERREVRGLVAYYWEGGVSLAHEVRNISSTGLYLLAEQRWFPGTLVTMTLQRTDTAGNDPDRSIAVRVRVVRQGTEGVGFAFVLPEGGRDDEGNTAGRKALGKFLRRFLGNKGQTG